jgi:hemolysin activation/secretion protein
MRSVALAAILCFFLAAVGFAETEVQKQKVDLEEALGGLRQTIEDMATGDDFVWPKDDTQRFAVKELRISGNTLISTAQLLRDMPLAYTVYETDFTTGKYKRNSKTGKRIPRDLYDFRVIIDIIVDPGQSRDVSLRTIQGLTQYVLEAYKDYRGIYVYVPAEAVEGDTRLVDQILPIHVLEGKVAQISVERYDFDRQEREKGVLKESVLRSWSPVKQGQVIQKKKVDDFVGLLNLNPDRYVSAVVSRSAEPNALNLSYDVYEANPWHRYVQIDNAGTKDRQWAPRLGVINTNLTGSDDRFSAMYQAPWEKGLEDEYSVFGSYDFPLFTPALRLNVYSGYSQFDIPAEGVSFLGNGSFFGTTLTYNLAQIQGWFVDLTGSLSHERSKITPSLGVASDVDMDLWGLGLNIHRRAKKSMSHTSLGFNWTQCMGGSSRDDFVRARLDTDSDFSIYTLSAAHSQYLTESKVNRFTGSLRFITVDERLVPAKMTTFGGLYSVRGYEEDEIVADGGILLNAQYEFDLVKYRQAAKDGEAGPDAAAQDKAWLRKLAPLAFVDLGRAKVKDPVPGEKKTRELASVGLGTVVELGDEFTAGLYYGWPLRATPETDTGEGRLNVSLIYRF